MPNPAAALSRTGRRRRIVAAGSLERVLDQPDGRLVLEAEAADPDGLISEEGLDHLLAVRDHRRRTGGRLGLFFSTDDVILVPGFMGCTLRDVRGGHGLIWIDPTLVINGDQLSALRLAEFEADRPDRDADEGVRVEPRDSVPALYDVMTADLEVRRYDVQVFPFDWRKDIDREAGRLADLVRARLGRKPRPLHLIAHSQGSLVARRAVQLLGAEPARRLVNNLVLLGPATFGTFSAAFALAGAHESVATIRRFGVKLPADFELVLRSFTGLYQLLPWDGSLFDNGFDPAQMGTKSFWRGGVDEARLRYGFGWGRKIDTAFFNDRTAIVLGEGPTVGRVEYVGGKLVQAGDAVPGDGTVPDRLAMLPGVRTYRAPGADHMTLPMSRAVMAAVRAILRGDPPTIGRVALAAADGVPVLAAPPPPRPAPRLGTAPAVPATPDDPVVPPPRPLPPAPPCRKLRVFSFDPLLATYLDQLGIAEIAIDVPWERDGQLGPGPVGDYLEVVDYDPSSNCFYHPLDLAHPRLAAQDGLPPSESNPQFHQQMAYAVSMATIAVFEQALGRVALWAPRLERDEDGAVVPTDPEEQYVPRLRVYPHALREANAYYDPDRHALLFGYFPSREGPGGMTLPGGPVFTCQSFDIVAHETTHALLHGLHRYYLYPTNPDVFAFHEAFADAVALFQHFSHPEVVRHQVARARGDLRRGDLLGRLARQFGQALGHRGHCGTTSTPTRTRPGTGPRPSPTTAGRS